MPGDLADARQRFAAEEIGPHEFHAVFSVGRVYVQATSEGGCLAFGDAPGGVVAAFSSLTALAVFAAQRPELSGSELRWFSTTGADLLSLLPAGDSVVLD